MNSRAKNPRLNQADEDFGNENKEDRSAIDEAFDARTIVQARPGTPQPKPQPKVAARPQDDEDLSKTLKNPILDRPTDVGVRLDKLERPKASAPTQAARPQPAAQTKPPWPPPPKIPKEDKKSVLDDNFDARTVVQTKGPKSASEFPSRESQDGLFDRLKVETPAPQPEPTRSSIGFSVVEENTQTLAQVEMDRTDDEKPRRNLSMPSIPKPVLIVLLVALVLGVAYKYLGSMTPSDESLVAEQSSSTVPQETVMETPAQPAVPGIDAVMEQFDTSFAKTQGQIRPDPLAN